MNDPVPLEISLVVPVHNEEANLEPFVEACLPALSKAVSSFEIIFVDDGSTDGTVARLRELPKRDSRLRAISLRRRFGKGAALAAGLARARGRRFAILDVDLQEDPAEITCLLAGLEEGLDLVSGWRRNRRDSWGKRLVSRVFNALADAVGLLGFAFSGGPPPPAPFPACGPDPDLAGSLGCDSHPGCP